jgi:hypothetical protein
MFFVLYGMGVLIFSPFVAPFIYSAILSLYLSHQKPNDTQTRCIPWNYIRFLSYAADRKLLQQTGGAYRFFIDRFWDTLRGWRIENIECRIEKGYWGVFDRPSRAFYTHQRDCDRPSPHPKHRSACHWRNAIGSPFKLGDPLDRNKFGQSRSSRPRSNNASHNRPSHRESSACLRIYRFQIIKMTHQIRQCFRHPNY